MNTRTELVAALRGFAQLSAPLVVCDYDGTLAPLVDDPDRAFPLRESITALDALASLAGTYVAVVSGRSLRDLAALCRFAPEVMLVGSHGSEFETGFDRDLDGPRLELLQQLAGELDRLAAADHGFIVERKPASVAFHYRKAPATLAEQAVDAVRSGPATRAGVKVKEGKKVIELAVIDADKGAAVDRLRHQVGADAVLFVGDDVTDEDAFAVLHSTDIGIKVGDGVTRAHYRLDGTDETAQILEMLVELRRSWLEGLEIG